MKTILRIVAALAAFPVGAALGAVAANDFFATQQKADNSGSIIRFVSPAASSLFGFASDKTTVNVTIGSNLTLTGNVLSANTAGTVTSVGLSMPSIFTVSNSPVTSSGTLTAVFTTQTANTVFAGPTSGGAATPTFRSFLVADISNLGTSVAGTLTANVGTAGGIVVNGGVLGIPLSGTMTNVSGLPLTTGVTGILPSANGGTGINNGSATLTMGGSHVLSGAFASTFTFTGTTSVTFPTSGTLATTAGTVASFSAGTTGFTPNSATTGAVTLAGTLATANGGTNLTSFTSGGLMQASSSSVVTTTLTPSGLTSLGVNSVLSAAGQNFTLGTGTFGTAQTIISATGVSVFNNSTAGGYGGAVPFVEVYGAGVTSADTDGGTIGAFSNTAFGINLGGAIVLGAKYSAGSTATMARMRSGKNNATTGDYGGYLAFDTRANSANMSEGMRLTSTRNLLIGTTTDLSGNGGLSVAGSILGSGGSAPTSTTTGSNIFTAGIATSGPGYFGGLITTSLSTEITGGNFATGALQIAGGMSLSKSLQTGGPITATTSIITTSSTSALVKAISTDAQAAFVQMTTLTGTNNVMISSNWGSGSGIMYFAAGTQTPGSAGMQLDNSKNLTVGGNLTVSGTGTSSVAGNFQVGDSTNGGFTFTRSTLTFNTLSSATNDILVLNGKGTGGLDFGHGNGSGGVRFMNGASGVVATIDGSGNIASAAATASTSTSTGALVLSGASAGLGMLGNLWVGGTGNFAGVLTAAAGLTVSSGQVLQVGNAYTVGVQVNTGYITIKDSTGTTYKVNVNL